MIDESARNIQLGIQRKQQRQPRRIDRVDALILAAVPPYATQTFVALAMFAEHNGWRVVQEFAERATAKCIIFACVKNEFVPQIVGNLRRHRDESLSTRQIGDEELTQAARNQRAVLADEAGTMFLEPREQPGRPSIGADELGSAEMGPFAIQRGCDNNRNECQYDRYA